MAHGNCKSGRAKLMTICLRNIGRKISMKRLCEYSGLTPKSVTIYVGWDNLGSFRKGRLNVSGFAGAV